MARLVSEQSGLAPTGILSELTPLVDTDIDSESRRILQEALFDTRRILSDKPWTSFQAALEANNADPNFAALLGYQSAETCAELTKLCCEPYLLAVLRDDAAFAHAVRVSLLCGRKANARYLCRLQLELTSADVTDGQVEALVRSQALRALADERITSREARTLDAYVKDGLTPQELFAAVAYDRSRLRPEYARCVNSKAHLVDSERYALELNAIGDAAAKACPDYVRLSEQIDKALETAVFRIPPERLAEVPKLFDAFGSDASALILLLGEKVLDLNPQEHQRLKLIHRTRSMSGQSAFDCLTPEEALDPNVAKIAMTYPLVFGEALRLGGVSVLFPDSPARRVVDAVISTCGEHAEAALSRLTPECCRKHAATIAALCEGAEPYGPQLFRSAPFKVLNESPGRILNLSLRWGAHTWGFFHAFQGQAFDVLSQHSAFFEGLHESLRRVDCDDEFGKVVASIRSTSAESLATYRALADACPRSMHAAFSGITETVLGSFPQSVLVAVAKAGEYQAPAAFSKLHELTLVFQSERCGPDVFEAWALRVGRAAQLYGLKFADLLRSCSTELLMHKLEDLCALADTFGSCAAAVCAQFGDRAVNLSETERRAVSEARSADMRRAAHFIEHVPYAKWDTEGRYLRQKFGGWSGHWYEMCPQGFWEDPQPALEDLLEKSRREFKISAAHRFVKWQGSALDTSLLEMNLENLDPNVRRDLPLMVVIVAEDDYNGALDREYDLLKSMSHSHKLMIFEARRPEDVLSAIDRVAFLHGADGEGSPAKTIDVLNFTAHGARDSLALGTTFRGGPDRSFRVHHATELATRARYFTRGGHGVAAACWTASDVDGIYNLLGALRQAVPHLTWWGSKRSVNVVSYQHDMLGRFHSPQFDCGPEKVVALPARV